MRRHKIYYIPGLISLLILFPLLYEALQKEKARHDYRVLEVFMFDPAELFNNRLNQQFYYAYPPLRDYLTLELTGDAIMDKVKLDYAQLRIREIENTGESIDGLNIHFADSAKYGSFVRAFDLLKRENATLYLAAKRDIWFWAAPKPRISDARAAYFGGCVCYDQVIVDPGTASQLEDLFYRFKPYWPISILFIALVLCAVRFMLPGGPASLKLVRVFAEMRGR
jgi:hypothetical protein